MIGVTYGKIELVVKNTNFEWTIISGTKLIEFTNARYSYTGNSLIITSINTIEDSEIRWHEETTNEIFSLDNVIKFKCTENVKKEN